MICEINATRSFQVDDGSNLERHYALSGVPVLTCGNYRFVQQCQRFLFNEMGIHCTIHCKQSDDDCPYVLVAKGRVSGANVKAARIALKALAVGLESHYLYNLD